MHIGFQKSGDAGGRGEYEIVGSHSGYNALSLEAWRFNMRWPDGIVRDTGLELDSGDSGKPRLRSTAEDHYQIGRMVAAMLLLPDPRRELAKTSNSLPIVNKKGYVLSRIGFGPNTEFDPVTDLVTIDPSFVNVTNLVETESIGVEQRWARINQIYAVAGQFEPSVRDVLQQHHAMLMSGGPIRKELTSTVDRLFRHMAETYPDFNKSEDPLPFLESLVGILPTDGPSLPPPDELGEDEPEVSARSAHQYRLAKVRGPAHRAFSIAVREAYRHRCVFCGGIYGGVEGVRAGVEAAHILAWSKVDLDVTKNGMSLCKTHHWAFDAALMVPEYNSGSYRLRFTELSLQFDQDSMRLLGKNGFVIPDEWFPRDVGLRPSRKYLERLYDDLAISLLAS